MLKNFSKFADILSVMPQPDEIQAARQWVGWLAGQIHDPVRRLRYLQALAPRRKCRRRHARKAIGFLAFLALALVVAPLSLRRLGAVSSLPPVRQLPPPVTKPDLVNLPSGVPVPPAEVWQIEKAAGFETYSNGLRIENQYAVSHRTRSYLAYPPSPVENTSGERRTDPAGIVYHTTESLQAPFEPGHNQLLKQVSESLLEYVRRRRCYNFLVDRFGRVYRIVNESDAADHAGYSVWADDRFLYVNLNDSFLGVSFEAETHAGGTASSLGPAQIHAAAMLTEMLRARYRIPARNCVTHAQVSVNPSNMQIGYHVDWASSFPFEKLGLPDNYATASPAVSLFGFAFDASFQQRAGPRLSAGALLAERALEAEAGKAHQTAAAYRKALQRRYRQMSPHRNS